MTRKLILAAVAGTLSIIPQAEGQISLTSGNLSYSQDFDSLTRSDVGDLWTDNIATPSTNDAPFVVGLEGWYAGNFGTTTVTPLIRAGTGSSASGAFYSFGLAGDDDRALGTLPQDSVASGSMRIGARFVNNTGETLTGFSFSYDGEQWRQSSANGVNNQFVVAYAIFDPGTGSLNSGLFTTITSATFNTPNDGDGSPSTALNGNLEANRVAGLGGDVAGLTILDGQEVWLRWFDSNSSGLDHGIGIDNFQITFVVPEPSAFALAGVGLGLFMLINRTRRRKI